MLPYPLPAYILGNGPEPRRFQILVLGFQNEYVIYVDAKGRLLRTFGEYIVTDWEYDAESDSWGGVNIPGMAPPPNVGPLPVIPIDADEP
jgi:hypothetical protein